MIARIAAARGCAKRGASHGSEETPPEAGDLHLRELKKWLGSLISADKTAVAATVLREIEGRVVVDWHRGDYLNLNRRSGTLSGGESQRIVSRHKSVRD
jgi:excinuclease ABC subunit A